MTDHAHSETWLIAQSKKNKVLAVALVQNDDSLFHCDGTTSIEYCNVEKEKIRFQVDSYGYGDSGKPLEVWYIGDGAEEKMEIVAKHSGTWDSGDVRKGYFTPRHYKVTWTTEPFEVKVEEEKKEERSHVFEGIMKFFAPPTPQGPNVFCFVIGH